MKKHSPLIWLLPLVLLLTLLPFLVPSSLPIAGAEGEEVTVPAYEPVTLNNGEQAVNIKF